MIKNSISQHVVQKMLGHEYPEMTSRYAHIFDETMKKEFQQFQEKLVSNKGQKVIPNPITKLKLIAKAVSTNSLRFKFPSICSETIGRRPSLNTAILRFAKTAATAPINITNINSIFLTHSHYDLIFRNSF